MFSQLLPLALAPFLVASIPMSLTPRQLNESEDCFARTAHLRDWGVSQFDFHEDDDFRVSVSFALTNPVLGTLTMCSGSDYLPRDPTSSVHYMCELREEDRKTAVDGAKLTTTSFSFNTTSQELWLRQTWVCEDNPQFTLPILATGGEIVPDGLTNLVVPVENMEASA